MKILLRIILFPLTILIRMLSSIVLIRFTPLKVARIGHLGTEIEIFLNIKTQIKKKIIIDFFFIRKKEKICNYTLFNIIKKKINILPAFIGEAFYKNNIFLDFKLKKKNRFHYNLNTISENSTKFFKRKIFLDNSDILKGSRLLKKLNIYDKDKIVCIAARDEGYLKKFREDFSYHSVRNADINKLNLTVKYLVSKGFKVVRIGRDASKKFSYKHKNVIDYSNSADTCDLLDLYLLERCEFLISSNSGIESIARIFRKPVIYYSFVPICDIFTILLFKKSFLIFKKFYSTKLKRFLKLEEVLKSEIASMCQVSQFKKKKILLKENSDKEILSLVKEFLKYNKTKKINTIKQKKFWKLYKDTNRAFNSVLNKLNYNSNLVIGENYLKKEYKL